MEEPISVLYDNDIAGSIRGMINLRILAAIWFHFGCDWSHLLHRVVPLYVVLSLLTSMINKVIYAGLCS